MKPWLIAASVMLATFMKRWTPSAANVALPHIARGLGAGTEESTWVLTIYLVANAIVLPVSGSVATLVGRKRLLIGCIVVFTLASAAARPMASG